MANDPANTWIKNTKEETSDLNEQLKMASSTNYPLPPWNGNWYDVVPVSTSISGISPPAGILGGFDPTKYDILRQQGQAPTSTLERVRILLCELERIQEREKAIAKELEGLKDTARKEAEELLKFVNDGNHPDGRVIE